MMATGYMLNRGTFPGQREHGVALAIVVWFIAGMSLLVAGIVSQARVDTQMAQTHVARAKATAAGDGAIQLMMVDAMTSKADIDQPLVGNYRLGDIEVTVALLPAAGLIDLNGASAEVLYALFLYAGGLRQEQARLLAENMVQSRTARQGRQGAVKLAAIEDFLRVPGSSRTLLDSVRDFIVVSESGKGGTNWSLAPAALLGILSKVDPAKADAAMARQGSAAASFPRSPGSGPRDRGKSGSLTGSFRADAIVRYGDKLWLRRRWISIESSPFTELPWHITRTEPPRVLMEDSYLI
jgi:general secretion pathway protein K